MDQDRNGNAPVRRPRRRGGFLLLFGIIWAAFAYGIFNAAPSSIQRVGLGPLIETIGGGSYHGLGWIWLGGGLLAGMFAFQPFACRDVVGFAGLMTPTVLYAASYGVTSLFELNTRGVVATCSYTALSIAVGIVAGWPDPPPEPMPEPHEIRLHLTAGVIVLALASQAVNGGGGLDEDAVTKILIALIGLAGVWYTRYSANRASARQVDAQAYKRAQEINEQAFERLEGEIHAVEAKLDKERVDHAATKLRARELQEERDRIRAELVLVRTRLERHARLLAAHDLPPLPDDFDERKGGHLPPPTDGERHD